MANMPIPMAPEVVTRNVRAIPAVSRMIIIAKLYESL